MSTEERAAKIVDTAVEVLQATGWCQGNLGEVAISEPAEDGQHCAIGCLAAAAHIHGLLPKPTSRSRRWFSLSTRAYFTNVDRSGSAYAAAVEAVFDCLPRKAQARVDDPLAIATTLQEKVDSIVEWNDTLGTDDKSKVVRVFRRAATKLRSQS